MRDSDFGNARDLPCFEFLIPLGADLRAERIAFAHQHELGLEITAFLSGPPLNDTASRADLEGRLAEELADFGGSRTFHGVFFDLALHSADAAIASLSRCRIERDILTAARLGCRKIVFHLGFNPLIGGSRYRTEFLDRHATFWSDMLAAHPGVEICLENQWEPDWTIFEDLFERVCDGRLGLCLDVAHAHVHSHFAPEAWLKRMKSHILHLHWTDNHGDRDRHAPLGAGNIDWPALFGAGAQCKTVTLEMNSLPDLRRSLAFLAQRGMRPTIPSRTSTLALQPFAP